jgi:hypothetical protein
MYHEEYIITSQCVSCNRSKQADSPKLCMNRGQANFLTAARRKTSGLLFTIETLYDSATIGLAALDFFTTTGARANELLQLRLSPDCLYAMKVGGTPRLLVRLDTHLQTQGF